MEMLIRFGDGKNAQDPKYLNLIFFSLELNTFFSITFDYFRLYIN